MYCYDCVERGDRNQVINCPRCADALHAHHPVEQGLARR